MSTVQPFTISVPQSVLDDLHARLDRVRLPNQIAGVSWEQGTELGYFTELLDHWRHRYDWRATEARLNGYDQFVTEVEGQRIHGIHVRSPRADALPIVITHGWPGSVMEFLDVIDDLRADFHLVIPSLPGFTFSGPTSEPGWHPRRIASAWAVVMERLGYERYGAQGGDWGSSVSTNLADLHPERVAGLHLNMVTVGRPSPDAVVTGRGTGRDRSHPRVAAHRCWVPGDPGHQAAVARLRPRGFAERAGGLDRREVPRVE